MESSIKTGLAILKSRLARDKFASQDRETMVALRADLEKSDSPYVRVFMDALQNALGDAEAGDIPSAAREIRLIHNLPVSRHALAAWDEAYFYRFELPEYLEEAKDVARTKSLLRTLLEGSNA